MSLVLPDSISTGSLVPVIFGCHLGHQANYMRRPMAQKWQQWREDVRRPQVAIYGSRSRPPRRARGLRKVILVKAI
jgi:hypothetical protein